MRPRPDRFSIASIAYPGRATVVERRPDGAIKITSASGDDRYLMWAGDPHEYNRVRSIAFALLELTEPDDAHDTERSPA